jgi:LDH2 family malate/lactate/ureidoglycolate dehydrogenase
VLIMIRSETKRALPIGFWKGSGLTIVLDMIAASLAGGQSTHEIQAQGAEYAVSQVSEGLKYPTFFAFVPKLVLATQFVGFFSKKREKRERVLPT